MSIRMERCINSLLTKYWRNLSKSTTVPLRTALASLEMAWLLLACTNVSLACGQTPLDSSHPHTLRNSCFCVLHEVLVLLAFSCFASAERDCTEVTSRPLWVATIQPRLVCPFPTNRVRLRLGKRDNFLQTAAEPSPKGRVAI